MMNKFLTFFTASLCLNSFAETDINKLNNQFKQSGNSTPFVHRLSAHEEAELLKDVEVPKGFNKSLFAPWQMANYPTYVAAAPNGDLYVSSDGNASGGRQKDRGRVIRLRDTDGDGRADENVPVGGDQAVYYIDEGVEEHCCPW